MGSENVLVRVRDGVAYLTLNRPEKLNALTLELMNALLEAVTGAHADDTVGCLVIEGAGRAFCSGWDLTPPSPEGDTGHGDRAPEDLTIREDIDSLTARSGRWSMLWTSTKPIIVKVQGYCLAGGTDLALNCDMIVAAEDAQFGFPAVRSIGSPATHMWTYMVGPQWAKRLLLSGERIDGRTAERIGLVMQAVPPSELDETVHALASSIAGVPYDLLAQNKSICNKAIELMGRTLLQELARESDAIAHKSPAAQEFSRIAKRDGLKAALAWQNR
ncbi:MAG: crotonase/enoyl-CoA hydratase family protein [Deltaproteobacteria bacterium]|jgi:enoyl-CoA hydratase|nr:crotonase/enoyl-CoA hydratase family protein [Deltaproteobacteria bacterium]MBW2497675.1 crotonase/enoyl-CoA hydratase family protein [Deltaproteobacteria bacterium]